MELTRIGWKQDRCRNGSMRRCAKPDLRSSCWRHHVRNALKTMPVKSESNDARGIAR